MYRIYPPDGPTGSIVAALMTGVPGGSGISYGGWVGTGWCSSGERVAPALYKNYRELAFDIYPRNNSRAPTNRWFMTCGGRYKPRYIFVDTSKLPVDKCDAKFEVPGHSRLTLVGMESVESSASTELSQDATPDHSDNADPVDAWKEPKIIAMDETVGNVRL